MADPYLARPKKRPKNKTDRKITGFRSNVVGYFAGPTSVLSVRRYMYWKMSSTQLNF